MLSYTGWLIHRLHLCPIWLYVLWSIFRVCINSVFVTGSHWEICETGGLHSPLHSSREVWTDSCHFYTKCPYGYELLLTDYLDESIVTLRFSAALKTPLVSLSFHHSTYQHQATSCDLPEGMLVRGVCLTFRAFVHRWNDKKANMHYVVFTMPEGSPCKLYMLRRATDPYR